MKRGTFTPIKERRNRDLSKHETRAIKVKLTHVSWDKATAPPAKKLARKKRDPIVVDKAA